MTHVAVAHAQTLGHCAFTMLLMMLGGVIAFLMVWVEFMVIAETSALTFMVAGTFKEIVTGRYADPAACWKE